MGQHLVIGAGTTGLALAWRLSEQGHDVRVLEALDRVGGALRTIHVDGMTLEEGPQSFRGGAGASWRTIEGLGLAGEVIEADPAASRRYILWDGRLRALPGDLFGMIPASAWVHALGEPLRAAGTDDTESVAAFVTRRVDAAFAERAADPFIAGVFGGDARRLEMAAAFPDLVAGERTYGSLVMAAIRGRGPRAPGPRRSWTLRGGLELLPNTLAARLGDRVTLGARVVAVVPEGPGVRVDVDGAPSVTAETVWVTAPGPGIAAAFPGLDLAVPAAQVVAVHLGFDGVPQRPGFGWLAAGAARSDVLGALWLTSTFPSHMAGRSVWRVMLGGARDPAAAGRSDQENVALAQKVLREVEGVDAAPRFTHVACWRSGIPQYEGGHLARVARLQAAIPGVRFLGWGYTGIGLEHGLAAAERAVAS